MPKSDLLLGDVIEQLLTLKDNSVDAVVTDPPYELGFMGKSWDSSGIAYNVFMWAQVLRVLKPGGHVLAFGGTRTYHRMACAIEDAGFEIRDQIQWLYGSGFPKSHNISKAIDNEAGVEREVVGTKHLTGNAAYIPGVSRSLYQNVGQAEKTTGAKEIPVTAPATAEAQQWDGWGSALKPANEPVCLARKALSGDTLAMNVKEWGTGGLNIKDSMIPSEGHTINRFTDGMKPFGDGAGHEYETVEVDGRWPANVILDEEAAKVLDMQSGFSKSVPGVSHCKASLNRAMSGPNYERDRVNKFSDFGGASRFFYVPKANKTERDAGLESLEDKPAGGMQGRNDGSLGSITIGKNNHPTVKPITLMRYLVKLITPPGGVVLDPFCGSGSTGCAAVLEGFDFIGIDRDPEYLNIANLRIRHWNCDDLPLFAG